MGLVAAAGRWVGIAGLLDKIQRGSEADFTETSKLPLQN